MLKECARPMLYIQSIYGKTQSHIFDQILQTKSIAILLNKLGNYFQRMYGFTSRIKRLLFSQILGVLIYGYTYDTKLATKKKKTKKMC